MNRETSIHSSDTLVVVDRSRQRRRMVILGAIAALALLIVGIALLTSRGSSGGQAGPAVAGGAGAGQVPTVTVVVPPTRRTGSLAVTRASPAGTLTSSATPSLPVLPLAPRPALIELAETSASGTATPSASRTVTRTVPRPLKAMSPVTVVPPRLSCTNVLPKSPAMRAGVST